jgi:hypothetical protein
LDEKEIQLSKNIRFSMWKHYKANEQCILGATVNSEVLSFYKDNVYEFVDYKRKKYELNLWLFWVSFHVEILGKTTELNTEI